MKRLLTIYLTLCAFVSFAQNPIIDSLQQALRNYDAKKWELRKTTLPHESDTLKVKMLNALGWEFMMISDYVAAEKYAGEALSVAKMIEFKKGIASSYNTIGVIYWYKGDYQEALKNHTASLKIKEETGDLKGISASYNNIGMIYKDQGNYPEALKNQVASLAIDEKRGDKKGIATSYNNIGTIYKDLGNYPEALKNHFAALKIRNEIGDKSGIADSYDNIGNIYLEQDNYPEALESHLVALKIYEEIGDKNGIATSYSSIGEIYSDQKNYPEALKNHFAALKIFEEIGSKNGIASCFISIGYTKIKMQATGEAKDWLMKGLLMAKELEAVLLLKSGYENLARADSALGNYKSAYENHKLFVFYRDILVNQENTKKIIQQQMQYDFDKKEAETKAITDAELKKQKLLRNGFVVGFVLMLLFAGVFFGQRNKTKKEKNRSEALLLNILPGEVADEIKNTGSAKAKSFTMVTVMFTDIKDFTLITEKISAELLVDEIHACFSAFDNILQKYKIEKIKTIGDAYLCASGLPISNYTHAVDMLNAAFEIRSYMLQRKKEKEAKGEISFEIRIGIHTGPVVAGVVGVKKYAYDIWGDTVNIAARMEQNSKAGKINISGATYGLVKDKFRCEHRGKIQAKNKGEIDMYFVETFS